MSNESNVSPEMIAWAEKQIDLAAAAAYEVFAKALREDGDSAPTWQELAESPDPDMQRTRAVFVDSVLAVLGVGSKDHCRASSGAAPLLVAAQIVDKRQRYPMLRVLLPRRWRDIMIFCEHGYGDA